MNLSYALSLRLVLISAVLLPAKALSASGIENSVVRIYSTIRAPDVYKPWMKQAATMTSGSGVIIEGGRILTCAHLVHYASQVEVQVNQSEERVPAKVEAIALDMDLAVLRLENAGFFAAHPALPRSVTLPKVRDSVLVYGYPTGGNSLSITKGIVSRIEFASYNGTGAGLRVQIDAAVNPGNSGGPVIVEDKMVGLVFTRLVGAQNIGYIVPGEEIDLFLADIADGAYDGKPLILDSVEGLANPALRAFLKLDKSVEGLLITRPTSSASEYPLRTNDIITRIGNFQLDNDGMIEVDGNLRVYFKYMVQKLARNGNVPLTIIRDGKKIEIELPVKPHRQFVLADLGNSYPSYFVCGPLVFSAASDQYLGGFMASRVGGMTMGVLMFSRNPMVERLGDLPAFPDEQLVVIATVFPHRLTAGYPNWAHTVIKSINGNKVRNLAHLVKLLREEEGEFVVLELDGLNHGIMVFPRRELLSSTDDVLNDNNIRSQGSSDMMAIWDQPSHSK